MFVHRTCRHVTSLGHQGGGEEFSEWGFKFFKLRPIFVNYVQQIFSEGAKNFHGGFAP